MAWDQLKLSYPSVHLCLKQWQLFFIKSQNAAEQLTVMSAWRIMSLSFLQILIQLKVLSSTCYNRYVSCIIDCEFTAIFPAASSPAQHINPPAAEEEEEAMTQEGAITRLSVESVGTRLHFLKFV